MKTAAQGTLAIGLIILALWLAFNNGSWVSTLILLQGISIVCLSILLYFVSPARHLSSEISDAMALANMRSIGRILSSGPSRARGIYEPANGQDPVRVVFPDAPAAKGSGLVPPGSGLYQYARSIGASFTEEGIENEMRDLLKNSLELAADASVAIYEDQAWVTLKGLVNSGLCASIRKEDKRICCRIGCPICSLVGCVIVDATKRKARIARINVKDDYVYIFFELMRG